MLVNEHESVRRYWDWWWENSSTQSLSRPYTIADDDPWLSETISKDFVDTESYREYLSEFTIRCQAMGALRRGPRIQRAGYRSDLVDHVATKALNLETPIAIWAGGGYGAGKTTIMDFLVRTGTIKIPLGATTGVDYFKAYLPEYSLLQALGDGRASTVVQKEARHLAEQVLARHIAARRSFGWDSSMSNAQETMPKIALAREAGYHLIMIAVFAPLEVAVRQAMERARKTKRFAHPDFLPKSHTDFQLHFKSYVPHFPEVYVFANDGTLGADGRRTPVLIASKVAPNSELAISDPARFAKFVGS